MNTADRFGSKLNTKVQVKRRDGTEIEIVVVHENFWGYVGYSDEGELITAYTDGIEAL